MKKLLSLVAALATFASVQAQSFFYTNSVAGNFTNTLSIDTNSFPILLTGITVSVTNGQYLKFYDNSYTNRYTNLAYTANVMASGWQTNYYTNFWLGTSAGVKVTNTVIGSNIARVFFSTNYTAAASTHTELPRVVEAYFQPSAPNVPTVATIYGAWTFNRGVTLSVCSNSQAIIQLQYTK